MFPGIVRIDFEGLAIGSAQFDLFLVGEVGKSACGIDRAQNRHIARVRLAIWQPDFPTDKVNTQISLNIWSEMKEIARDVRLLNILLNLCRCFSCSLDAHSVGKARQSAILADGRSERLNRLRCVRERNRD